jgi:VanZ family protein
MLAIFLLSAQETLPETPGVSDQVMAVLGHLVSYGVLATLVYLALPGDRGSRRAWRLVAAIAASTLYGVTDEFHQSFVPGRHASVFDVGVDATVAVLAALVIWAVEERGGRWRL